MCNISNLIDHIEGTADITDKAYNSQIRGISVTNFGASDISLTLKGFTSAITIPPEITWQAPVNVSSFSLVSNSNEYAIDIKA